MMRFKSTIPLMAHDELSLPTNARIYVKDRFFDVIGIAFDWGNSPILLLMSDIDNFNHTNRPGVYEL